MTHAPGYDPTRSFAFLIASHLLFILLDATAKALGREMGVPLVALARHAGQALLMVVVLGATMKLALVRCRRPGLQMLRGLALSGFTVFFFGALRHLPQAEATAINFISPFVVMLLAGPVLGERVTWFRWTGAIAGFAGMLLIVRPGTSLPWIGIVFVLLTVVCNIVVQLATRALASSDSSVATIFLSSLVGSVVSAALLPLQQAWGGWPGALSATHWTLLASTGVLGALSQWCLVRAYYWGSASFIAPLVFLQIVWAMLSGWLFFGQLPDELALVGMAVIVLAGSGAILAERRTLASAVQRSPDR